ncbi:hypothetical protein ACTNEN_09625 [Oribacterium sp. HCP28S3_H8]|uniref:hypothetical protein n=1 Tax=Oribacterium sp. HCP28S3_H8 TaxID=3438945 RepID=UPI003F8BD0E7
MMTAKEYLSQVYKLSREIESNKRRIAELESEIGGLRAIDYSGDKVQSSPVDSLSEGIARLDEMQRRLITDTVKLQRDKGRILEEIRSLPDTRYIEILTLRYVDCERWETIASNMHESIRHIFRIHGDALVAFSKMYIN